MKPGEIKPNVIAKAKRCTEVHAKNIGMAYRKGVKVAFGTDVCAPYLYHGTQAEEFVYMVNEAGMKPAHALRALLPSSCAGITSSAPSRRASSLI